MKNVFIMIMVLCFAVSGDYVLSYTLTDAQAVRLSAAVIGFRPIPKINTGTEENPVWEDSCGTVPWVKKVIKDYLRNTVLRWEEKLSQDSIVIPSWNGE